MKRMSMIALVMVSLVTLAIAHGSEQHVVGTVSKIAGNQVTVTTINSQQVTVTVTDKTEFTTGDVKATFGDLKVGDRVVIHAVKKGTILEAHVVKFGTTASGSKVPSKH